MATQTAPAPADAAAPKKGGKKKLVIIGVVVLVLGGGGAYKFLGSSGSKEPEKPKPGAVVKLDPIQVNLAGGHYLKLGLALQATVKAKEEPDGSKALDAAISLFSQRDMTDLSSNELREKLKKKLVHELEEAYEDEVMDVYFTEFVMQ